MRVQNYAGSGIKRAVSENAPQADTRSVCVIWTTVGQYFNWYRASRASLVDSGASVWLLECNNAPRVHFV